MKIHYKDNFGNIILTNLDACCSICENECQKEGFRVNCGLNSEENKVGKLQNSNGSLFLCLPKQKAKTTKLFKEKLELYLWAAPDVKKYKEKIFEEISHFTATF